MNGFLQKDWPGQCQVYVVQGMWEDQTVKQLDQYLLGAFYQDAFAAFFEGSSLPVPGYVT